MSSVNEGGSTSPPAGTMSSANEDDDSSVPIRAQQANRTTDNPSSSLHESQSRNKRPRQEESPPHNPRHRHQQRQSRDVDHNNKDGLDIAWDSLADGPMGDIPLTQYLPAVEIDNLIGWATNVTQSAPVVSAEQPLNPLAGLSSAPLPASLLFLLHNFAGEHLATYSRMSLYEGFDQSALVALGMVLEESITASLMPLARAHVARCRRLEDEEASKNDATSSSSATCSTQESPVFREWTLPPAEAVAKLCSGGGGGICIDSSENGSSSTIETELPSTRPPDRNGLPSAHDVSILHMPSEEKERNEAFSRWCTAQGLTPEFVQKNMDIFGTLVSNKTLPG